MGNYVLDLDFCFDEKHTGIVPLAAYDATTSKVFQVMGLNATCVMVKNTGAAALTYNILGSLDRGEEYDLTAKVDTVVNAGASDLVRLTDYYTHLKVQIKSAGATTATIKAAGQSV